MTSPEERKTLREILAQGEEDWAKERLQEIQEILDEECLHYDRVIRRFNGGRGSLFCLMCGFHIGDLSEGPLVAPLSWLRSNAPNEDSL
jgi:hypothetical protein